MTYVVEINPGTDRCRDFFNFLSAKESQLSRAWPENVGLKEAMDAGINDEDYNWYIDDLQNAKSIERFDGPNGEKNARFRIEFENMSKGTPAVIEALMGMTNRQAHAHINSAVYLKKDGGAFPLSKKQEPVPF